MVVTNSVKTNELYQPHGEGCSKVECIIPEGTFTAPKDEIDTTASFR